MRKLATIALLALPCSAALAQLNAAADPDPLYHIEIIIYALNEGDRAEEDFRHGQPDEAAAPEPRLYRLPRIELASVLDLDTLPIVDETAAPSPEEAADAVLETALDAENAAAGLDSAPDVAEEGDSLELFDAGAGSSARYPARPDGFRILTSDELELTDARNTLRRLRAYTVLGHVGWAQTTVDSDRALALDLKWLGITNPTGTIQIYRGRFPHAAIDFEFFDGSGSFWSRSGAGLAPLRYAESYRMQDERNAIRSGELHGLDHPLFGVLIQITPAPDPEPEEGGRERPAG